MKTRPKYNVDYCGNEIKKALQRVARGSITREEASNIIVNFGRKIGEMELIYEPDEVLDFSQRYDVT